MYYLFEQTAIGCRHLFVWLFGSWVSESTNSYCIGCNSWFLQLGVVCYVVMEGQLDQKHSQGRRTWHSRYLVLLNIIEPCAMKYPSFHCCEWYTTIYSIIILMSAILTYWTGVFCSIILDEIVINTKKDWKQILCRLHHWASHHITSGGIVVSFHLWLACNTCPVQKYIYLARVRNISSVYLKLHVRWLIEEWRIYIQFPSLAMLGR